MKTACELPRENDLRDLLSLAESSANSIEKLVLDGGKIPEVSSCLVSFTAASRNSSPKVLRDTQKRGFYVHGLVLRIKPRS